MSRDAYEQEHLDDMPDHADAFALLDDGVIRSSRCPHCCNFICSCMDDSDEVKAAQRRYRRNERGDPARRTT